MSLPKQVIVMRKDLNMRKGKMVAQGSHASLAIILDMFHKESHKPNNPHFKASTYYSMELDNESPTQKWLDEKFTKICVSVNSEQELLDVYQKAKDANLPCALITDSGATEFHGVPTKTCCAIGPAMPEQLDPITGHLKLL